MITPDDKKKILELRKQGFSIPKIAEIMNLSISTINRVIKEDLKNKSQKQYPLDYDDTISPRDNTSSYIKNVVEKLKVKKNKSYENKELLKGLEDLLIITENEENAIIEKTRHEDKELYTNLIRNNYISREDYMREIESLKSTHLNEINQIICKYEKEKSELNNSHDNIVNLLQIEISRLLKERIR